WTCGRVYRLAPPFTLGAPVGDDPINDFVQVDPRSEAHRLPNLGDVGHAPRHILEAVVEHRAVRDELDPRVAAGPHSHPLRQVADADLGTVTDIEDFADRLRFV